MVFWFLKFQIEEIIIVFVCTMEGQVMKSLERSNYITVFANNDTPKKNHISISFILMTLTSGKSHLISDRKVQEDVPFHAAVEFQDVFQHESAVVYFVNSQ